MERAALFKKKNYGKLISDVSIVTESNHKRVVDILCSIFQDVLKRPMTEVNAIRNNNLQIQVGDSQASDLSCKNVPYGTRSND